MKLGWVIHYVPDVAATLAFYEKAFGLKRGMLTPDAEFGTLVTGETTLAFCNEDFARHGGSIAFAPVRADKPAPAFEIALVTDDVEMAYAHAIASGAVPVEPPTRKPWGQVVSYMRDCNGFLVEICSPISP